MALGNLLVSIRATAAEWAADIKSIQKEGRELEKSIKPIKDELQTIGTAMAAAGTVVVGTFAAMTKITADYGDQLNDARQRTGATVEDLAKLGFVAEQSGSSFEGMSTGLKFLSKNMEDASAGGKKQKQAFDALGISVVDATGKLRPAKDVFMDVADRFSRMEDGADKTAVAMDIFGKAGADLIPTLNAGRKGIEEMGETAERLGVVISGDAARAADQFNDGLAELQAATKGVTLSIGNAFIPVLTDLFKKASDVIVTIRQWADAHPSLIQAVGVLAAGLTGAGGLLLGLTGVLTVLPKLQTAFTLLTGPVGLTIGAFAGLVAGIVYFRNEIASGLLKSLSLGVEGFSVFIGYAARAADAIGLDGMAGRLNALSGSTLQTASNLTMMGDSFLETTGVVIGNTDAVNKAIAAAQKHTFELGKNTEAADKAKDKIAEMLAKNVQALRNHLEQTYQAGQQWIGVMSDVYSKDLDAKVKAFDTIEKIIAKNRVALGQHLEGVAEDNRKWIGVMSDDYSQGLEKRIKDIKEAEKKNQEAYEKTFESVKQTASRTFTEIFADGKLSFSKLADAIKGIFTTLANEILSSMTATLITPLVSRFQNAIGGLMGGIPGLGSVFGGGAVAAGSRYGSSLPQAPGLGGFGGGGALGGGSGLLGGILAGAGGIIGGAISGGMSEGNLRRIEEQTRETRDWLEIMATAWNEPMSYMGFAMEHMLPAFEEVLKGIEFWSGLLHNDLSVHLLQGIEFWGEQIVNATKSAGGGIVVLTANDPDARSLINTLQTRGDVRADVQRILGIART